MEKEEGDDESRSEDEWIGGLGDTSDARLYGHGQERASSNELSNRALLLQLVQSVDKVHERLDVLEEKFGKNNDDIIAIKNAFGSLIGDTPMQDEQVNGSEYKCASVEIMLFLLEDESCAIRKKLHLYNFFLQVNQIQRYTWCTTLTLVCP